jgi:hypothetical protein
MNFELTPHYIIIQLLAKSAENSTMTFEKLNDYQISVKSVGFFRAENYEF